MLKFNIYNLISADDCACTTVIIKDIHIVNSNFIKYLVYLILRSVIFNKFVCLYDIEYD